MSIRLFIQFRCVAAFRNDTLNSIIQINYSLQYSGVKTMNLEDLIYLVILFYKKTASLKSIIVCTLQNSSQDHEL